MKTSTERCPWCGSTISHDKFVQIQAAIRKEEQQKLATAERAMKSRIEKEVAALVAGEQKKLLRAQKLIEAERAKLATSTKQQLTELRAILEKNRDEALRKKDAEFARERDAMQKKISDMSRRMLKKSSNEPAEGTDLDLYEELRGAFPEDHIIRLNRARSGDILHEVRHRGKVVGRILIDARHRGAWQHSLVTRLRQDQTEVEADQAILSTAYFPAGKRELYVDGHVLVSAPARVPVVVEVLRKALIAMHVARLSDAERADKLGRLYKFMTSASFKRKLSEAQALAGEALEIDVEEKRAHDNIWKKRGTILTRIRHVLREIDTEVGAIVESKEDAPILNATVTAPGASTRVH